MCLLCATPTRAPDNLFRKMKDELTYIRDTSLLKIWGWARGSYSLGESRRALR